MFEHKQSGNIRILFTNLAYILVTATILMWTWNSMLVELFEVPKLEFQHSFSLLLSIALMKSILTLERPSFSSHNEQNSNR